jgi:hypothetical protein
VFLSLLSKNNEQVGKNTHAQVDFSKSSTTNWLSPHNFSHYFLYSLDIKSEIYKNKKIPRWLHNLQLHPKTCLQAFSSRDMLIGILNGKTNGFSLNLYTYEEPSGLQINLGSKKALGFMCLTNSLSCLT